MLVDAQERLSDHQKGSRILDDEELKKLENKIKVFQKKLEQLKQEPTEREVERIMEREKLLKERNLDRKKRAEMAEEL